MTTLIPGNLADLAEPSSRLAGRVFETSGLAAPQVEVTIRRVAPPSNGQTRSLVTDEMGYFSVDVDPGLYRLRVDSRWVRTAYVAYPVVLEPVILDPRGASSEDVNPGWLEESPDEARPPLLAQIEGKAVEHRLLGDPVAGAWAWIEGYGELAVESSEDGTFRLPVPNSEGLGLRVEKPGYIPARAPALGGPEGEVVTGWSVVLHPAAYLQGLVVDDGGGPVAAEVEVIPLDRDSASPKGLKAPFPHAYTDRDGIFAVATAPGETVELRVTAPGHVEEAVELTTPQTGAWSREIRVTLARAAVASGRVLSEEGRPIAGATVSPVPWGAEHDLLRILAGRKARSHDIAASETDREGHFLLQDLPSGHYSLAVVAEGFEPVAVSGLTIAAGEGTQPLGTVFLAPAATLSGQVVDASGDPVDRAEVYVSFTTASGLARAGRPGVAATSDERGEFTVGGLARGSKVQLAVRRDGFLPTSVAGIPVPSDDPVQLELHRAAALTGRVLDDQGDPVEGARVTARPRAARGSLLRSDRILSQEATGVTTDAEGVYRIVEAEPGPTTLEVQADCCRPHEESLDIAVSDRPTVVDVTLHRGASARGRVLGFDGRPVAGASVRTARKFTTTTDDGQFRFQGLDEGTVTLNARHPRHGRTQQTVRIGDQAEIEIRFSEPARVTGRVVDDSGTGIAEADVLLACETDRWRKRISTAPDSTAGEVGP